VRINVPGEPLATRRLHAGLRAVLAPEAVLFDVDGVLVDVSRSYREAVRATAARWGVLVSAEDIAAAKAAGDANNDWVLTQRLLAAHGVEVPLAEVTRRFEELYQGHAGSPGLKHRETARLSRVELEALAARYPLALVTGRPRRDAMELVEREGWSGLFRAAVCMGEAAPKPDPAPVRAALAALGVGSAWMLGDTVDDVRAARAAGVVPLGIVAPGEDPERAAPLLLRAGAARVLPTPSDLAGLLP
jgi:HAD superfamily hydrolase (TIGR01548 family)